jgi:excisionase family DNA binding protein
MPHTEQNITDDDSGRLLSIPKVAKILGIGRSKAYDMAAKSELTVVALGRRRLIVRDSLEAFIRSRVIG